MRSTDAVQRLADHQAITDLIYRYCRSVDRLDAALGHSVWHEDGIADFGPAIYQGDGRGGIDVICARHRQALHHAHQVSNILIELDGDHAGSESYVTALVRVMRGDRLQQITVWARYIDTWSRRNGHWGLDKRVAVIDFDEIRDVTAMRSHETGRRDRGDPSYAALRGPASDR